jgi:hypothetical protein
MSENPADRARKYIASFEKNVGLHSQLTRDVTVKASDIDRVSDALRRYLRDARFYLTQEKPATALASIAYAEGLLDALIFLHLTEPRTKGKE